MKKVFKILFAVHIIWWSAGLTGYAQSTDTTYIAVIDSDDVQKNVPVSWYAYNDGGSTFSPSPFTLTESEGVNGIGNVAQMTFSLKTSSYVLGSFVGMGFSFGKVPLDLTGTAGITFYHKGSSVELQVATPATGDGSYQSSKIPAHDEWTKVTILWSELFQPYWSWPVPFDLSKVTNIQWQKQDVAGATGQVWIDEVQIETNLTTKPTVYSIIADAENSDTTKLGTLWYSYADNSSTVSTGNKREFIMSSPGANGTNHAAKINYTLAQWVGFGFTLNKSDPFEPYDLTGSTGISFYHKGTGVQLGIATTAVTNAKFICNVPAHTDWTKVSLRWESFRQPAWGSPQVPFDISQVRSFDWEVNSSIGSPYRGEVWIDEVQIDGIELDLTLPKAGFSYIPGISGITFTNTSQYADKYTWDFGDGQKSTQVHPFHTYEPGVYPVTLIAEKTRGGEDATIQWIEIMGIKGISNNKGGNNGIVSIVIYGGGLSENMTVKFVKDGEIISTAHSVYQKEPGAICASFDLTDKPTGIYDVVITHNGKDYVITDGFTIEEANYPKAFVKIEGNNAFIPGRWQTYTVNYGNRGNIDIFGLPINLIFNDLSEVELLFDLVDNVGGESTNVNDADNYVKQPSLYGTPFNGKMYSVLIPHIPANTASSFTFRLKENSRSATKMYVSTGEILNDVYFNTQVEEMEDSKIFGYSLTKTFKVKKETLSQIIRNEINGSFTFNQIDSRKHFVNFTKLLGTSNCFSTLLKDGEINTINGVNCLDLEVNFKDLEDKLTSECKGKIKVFEEDGRIFVRNFGNEGIYYTLDYSQNGITSYNNLFCVEKECTENSHGYIQFSGISVIKIDNCSTTPPQSLFFPPACSCINHIK